MKNLLDDYEKFLTYLRKTWGCKYWYKKVKRSIQVDVKKTFYKHYPSKVITMYKLEKEIKKEL